MRLLVGIAILVTAGIVWLSDLSLLEGLVIWLIVLPIFDWIVAIYLVRAALIPPHITSLTERALVAVLISITATIAGVLGTNRLAGCDCLPDTIVGLSLLGGLLLISAPALYWVHLYRSGRFGDDES